MMTIKRYAAARGISYEAARKTVNRYKNDLEDHISRQNRTQYLDDWAVEFLDQHRMTSPVSISVIEKNEELETLRKENTALLQQVAALQQQLIDEMACSKKLLEEKQMMLQEHQQQMLAVVQQQQTKHGFFRRKKKPIDPLNDNGQYSDERS